MDRDNEFFDDGFFDPTRIEDYQEAVKKNKIMFKVKHPWQKLYKNMIQEIRMKKRPAREYYAYRFPLNKTCITPKLPKRQKPVAVPYKNLCTKELEKTKVTGRHISNILKLIKKEENKPKGNDIVQGSVTNKEFHSQTHPGDADVQRNTDQADPNSNESLFDDIREIEGSPICIQIRAEDSFSSDYSVEIDILRRNELRNSNDSEEECVHEISDSNIPGPSHSDILCREKINYESSHSSSSGRLGFTPDRPGRRGLFKRLNRRSDIPTYEEYPLTRRVLRRNLFSESPHTPYQASSTSSGPETSRYAPQKTKKNTIPSPSTKSKTLNFS